MGSTIRREDASVLESDQLTRRWYQWYYDFERNADGDSRVSRETLGYIAQEFQRES
jgi:hypothetical protein